jgi:hypothetical protein
MEEIKYVTLKGVCDLHAHSSKPNSDEPRVVSDIYVAQQAAAAGMEAIVFKSHYEGTVARAFYVNQAVPNIKIFGGIALNRYVGGLNPLAVEATLVAGGKVVWMPGIDAARHKEVFASLGSYEVGGKVVGPIPKLTKTVAGNWEGFRITENGKLKKEAIEIVRLVVEHDAIVTSGHLNKDEIFELALLAKKEGAKMLIDHPMFYAPGFTYDEIDKLKELTKLGAYIGFFAGQTFPADTITSIRGDKKAMEELGPERCVIASDCGLALYPLECEALRTYAQDLFSIGMPLEHLEVMMVKNPRKLLSL